MSSPRRPDLANDLTMQCSSISVLKEQYCGCSVHTNTISLPQSLLEVKEFIPERKKTLLTFAIFFMTILLNHFVLAIILDIISRDPLPDLAHSLIPQHEIPRLLADSLAAAGSVSMFIILCIFHKYRWIIGRRLFYIGTVLYIMRAISICVTHIPSGYENNNRVCVPPSEDFNLSLSKLFQRFLDIGLTMGLQLEGSNHRLYCGDMLFSGHTTAISTSCFFLNYYTPHSLWPLKLAFISICVLAMGCIVISRSHYSVDVIMGYWISSIIFSLYHAFCEVPHDIRPRTRAFRRLLLFWTMFEEERFVPAGRLPNKLEWPLPWPKKFAEVFEDWNEQSPETMAGSIAKWLAEHRIKFHV